MIFLNSKLWKWTNLYLIDLPKEYISSRNNLSPEAPAGKLLWQQQCMSQAVSLLSR